MLSAKQTQSAPRKNRRGRQTMQNKGEKTSMKNKKTKLIASLTVAAAAVCMVTFGAITNKANNAAKPGNQEEQASSYGETEITSGESAGIKLMTDKDTRRSIRGIRNKRAGGDGVYGNGNRLPGRRGEPESRLVGIVRERKFDMGKRQKSNRLRNGNAVVGGSVDCCGTEHSGIRRTDCCKNRIAG